MRVVSFPVTSTNIFPIANSTAGGQLVTEHNLRCKEFVSSKSSIQYECGPSYVHSLSDFSLSRGIEGVSNEVTTSKFTISPGAAIIDGYYIQLLTPIEIDIDELNAEAKMRKIEKPLGGTLGVGLKIMYSGETTMSGSTSESATSGTIKPEGEDSAFYEGIVVVILPESELISPDDTTGSRSRSDITCNLKLGSVVYDSTSHSIQGVSDNPEKTAYIYPERLHDITSLISETAVTRDGVSVDKFYTFSGRTKENQGGWCDSTSSMIIWDKDYASNSVAPGDTYFPSKESSFVQTEDSLALNLAHKQPDSGVLYKDKMLKLPKASYSQGTPGIVSPDYTSAIKSIGSKVNTVYDYTKLFMEGKSKFLGVIDTLDEETSLPSIKSTWENGSYLVVVNDETVALPSNDVAAPSTLKIVYGNKPKDFTFHSVGSAASDTHQEFNPIGIDGQEIKRYVITTDTKNDITLDILSTPDPSEGPGDHPRDYVSFSGDITFPKSIQTIPDERFPDKAIQTYVGSMDGSGADSHINFERSGGISINDINTNTHKLTDDFIESITNTRSSWVDDNGTIYGLYLYYRWKARKSDIIKVFEQISDNENWMCEGVDNPSTYDFSDILGSYGDYITIIHKFNEDGEDKLIPYFYVIDEFYPSEWKSLLLTNPLYIASEDMIGGVRNVPDTAIGGGYVHVNENGYMQLLDYDLLRQGVLAYQLGEDLTFSRGITTEELQADIDEVLNSRVAFPKDSSIGKPSEIVVDINLSRDGSTEEPVYINIHGIDSRFNTHVHFKFSGEADNNTYINIYDCEKIKISKSFNNNVDNIDNTLEPVFTIKRCGLYYDPTFIDNVNYNRSSSISAPFEDITFWTDDPNLLIENNTVQQTGGSLVSSDITYASESQPNDNHFQLGLRSITFDRNATVVNMEIFVSNQSTMNVRLQDNIVVAQQCELPQGTSLQYPVTSMKKQIRISGSFVSSYQTDQTISEYVILDTQFTMITKKYDMLNRSTTVVCDTLFHSSNTNEIIQEEVDSSTIAALIGSNQFHIFSGGALN